MQEIKEKAVNELQKVQETLSRKSLQESEMKEKIDEDLFLKERRRKQSLEDRVAVAKKVIERVDSTLKEREVKKESLREAVNEDLANKENKRRSFLQGVVESCRKEVSVILDSFILLVRNACLI